MRFTFARGDRDSSFTRRLHDADHAHRRKRAPVRSIRHVRRAGGGAPDSGFLDEVTFDYRQIRWEYKTQKPTGRPSTTVKGGWDVAVNKKL
jgi:hypothetical protein